MRYADRIEDRGRVLTPLPRSGEYLRHIRLPQGAEPYGQADDVVANVVIILKHCLDLDDAALFLMTTFAISTWLPEKVSVAPYLALVGPPGSGKTTALRALSLLCYRGLLTADISSSAFYDISERVRPTILLDETLTAGRPCELIHLLKASSTPDCVSLRRDKARLAFGPKAFSWLELPDDQALNSRCIIVPMHKTSRTTLKDPKDPRVLEWANRVRMRLLQFRFERLGSCSVPTIPSNVHLFARPLDLYRALAIPLDDEKDRLHLGALIARQSESQAALLSPAQASTIRILYNSIHSSTQDVGFRVKRLAAAVNADLASRGESAGLKERKVGDILTSLSFTNRTRNNQGFVLRINRTDRAQIHATARDYRVEGTNADPIDKCEICTPTSRSAPATAEPPISSPAEGRKSRVHRERRVRRSGGRRSRTHVESD